MAEENKNRQDKEPDQCAGLCTKWVWLWIAQVLAGTRSVNCMRRRKAGCKESTLTRKSILVHTDTDDDENGGDSKYQYTITDVITVIKQTHNSLSNQLKSFKTELSRLQESTQFMSNSLDELQKENKEMKRRLEEESRDLHNAKKRTSDFEEKIDSIVGEELEKNIVIMNVPKQEQEKTE
ncbi:hypothetical protein HHI36_019845 [Cryptolaemus montrouzieri]|uniref:Uncharacterized protein n=1 Tax=Cryptolaemus montrouzieri TaxID=559131 RepID=A0ABD2N8T1_9CUCU